MDARKSSLLCISLQKIGTSTLGGIVLACLPQLGETVSFERWAQGNKKFFLGFQLDNHVTLISLEIEVFNQFLELGSGKFCPISLPLIGIFRTTRAEIFCNCSIKN